ncbi:alpha/beta fold hydrolase [Frankia sp. KB5]|uniref:thioesterase II family protein n=1 Tax=Frankia sp. KB5 TaxID=683318 RepID=UPI000A121879|nr:alpha/beta fold hydrolase [Frankia sp. KB5]ORT47811.1 hypothetical protein KBI5_17680 [Frankia sp. KB5]
MPSWFLFSEPGRSARIRLFCFPYAGGVASGYREWWQRSNSDIQVAPVQLPGRENRIAEPAVPDLYQLVSLAAQALRDHVDRPYALFGHSMGAMIAYELSRYLAKMGSRPPVRLLVSGMSAPDLLSGTSSPRRRSREEIIAELRRLHGTPSDMLENEQILDFLLPRLQADWQVTESFRYRPGPRLAVPISVFGGTADPDVPITDLLAWNAHTKSDTRIRLLPGDHFFVDRHSSTVADLVFADIVESLRSD